jgi:hypothetical protein
METNKTNKQSNSTSLQSVVSKDLDQTYGAGVTIELKPGMAWALYCDDGPGGACGQSMRTTCPHSVLMTWPNETAMREDMNGKKWRNKKHRIMWGIVDDYTAGGVFRVVQSG